MQTNIQIMNELDIFDVDILTHCLVRVEDEWNYHNVVSSFSRLFYIEEGSSNILCNGKTVHLIPGNVYLVPAGTCACYCCASGGFMKKLFFHISLLSADSHDLLTDLPKGVYQLTFEQARCEQIFRLYGTQDYRSLLELRLILYQTLLAFYSRFSFPVPEMKNYSAITKNVMQFIQNRLNINLTVGEIAESHFVSKGYLCKLFKKETGISVGRYIDELVFFRAKKLLLTEKEQTIRQIAESLGFHDQSYFSRRFKEKYGESPAQYRKEQI